MVYNLDPENDSAALTAMMLYARLTDDALLDEELRRIADNWSDENLTAHTFGWSQFLAMSKPNERSLEATEAFMDSVDIEPLCFIARDKT